MKDELKIQQALKELETGKISSIRKAAIVHDVKHSTSMAR